MKFRITTEEKAEVQSEKEVEAYLKIEDGDLILHIGKWNVFIINSEGVGELPSFIDSDNDEGLQVDEDGKIILEEDDDE